MIMKQSLSDLDYFREAVVYIFGLRKLTQTGVGQRVGLSNQTMTNHFNKDRDKRAHKGMEMANRRKIADVLNIDYNDLIYIGKILYGHTPEQFEGHKEILMINDLDRRSNAIVDLVCKKFGFDSKRWGANGDNLRFEDGGPPGPFERYLSGGLTEKGFYDEMDSRYAGYAERGWNFMAKTGLKIPSFSQKGDADVHSESDSEN